VKGPTVAPGEAGPDGWLHTGDLGELDGDGHLHVRGRADNVIVTGGENVSPEEVERVLLDHPAVVDAVVYGRDDPQWQSAVVASVVLAEGTSVGEAELRDFCRERLTSFKTPKAIEPVNELPRNEQGKLLRGKLG
jgi:acyl-coenzyme A synthetase/AMP-(fatty) acid ligase